MTKLKYVAKRSAWTIFRLKMVWITLLIDIVCIAYIVFLGLQKNSNNETTLLHMNIYLLGLIVLIISLIIYTICYYYAVRVRYYFYNDHIIKRVKFFSVDETNIAFFGVLEVNVEQTFWQRLFHYGNVKIDYVGQYSIDNEKIIDIANPNKLRKYLLSQIAREREINKIITN